MATLVFDKVDDFVQSSSLGIDITGAFTVGAIVKRASITGFQAVLTLHNATTPRLAMEFDGTNEIQIEIDGGTADHSTTTVTDTTNWWFVAASKAAPSGVCRFHFKNLTGLATTVHEAGTTNILAPSTQSGGFIKIGNYGTTNTDDYDGSIAAVFAFDQDLGDAGVDTLLTNRKTSDIWNYSGGHPKLLVECTALTPTDLAGLTTFSAASGAVLTGANPDNWTLDGIGATTPATMNHSFQAIPFMTR
jgi:hypothetical protein